MSAAKSVQYNAIAAYDAKGELKPFKYVPMTLKPNFVEVAISACGVCHTDLHQVKEIINHVHTFRYVHVYTYATCFTNSVIMIGRWVSIQWYQVMKLLVASLQLVMVSPN
jgi:hypothetical protein